MKYNSLQQAVIGVLQEKKIKHPNQQVLDVHEPEKDELTAADFKKLRAGKKANEDYTLEDFTVEELEAFLESEDGQQLDELSYDKLNNYMREKRKRIGRATVGDADRLRGTPKGEKLDKDVANYRKAWAKRDMKEDTDPVQETTILHDSFQVQLKDSYSFGEYLTAAKKIVGEDDAIEIANAAFQEQDLSIFAEEMSHSAVEDRVKAHMKAGHKVSMPKYSTRDGKPRAEYVVTDKDSGVRRKYIHQGNVTKMENMGARGKRDEK